VIKGLCDHFGLSIFFARAAIVALAILTSAWIVALFYLAAFLIMPLEPRGSSGRSWTAARP
jgi:phage shock protein PspC (stress-responsive transcriptional regulator)